jgi:hypothetical protein
VPSYKFICKNHDEPVEFTKILPKPLKAYGENANVHTPFCMSCGKLMERSARGPSAQVKETLDNGAMTTKIERFKDAEKLYKDRAEKNK